MTLPNNKGLNIFFWNAQSLINKLDSFKQHVEKVSPDIYGLSETWFREEVSDNLVDINDYSIYRNDRQVRTKYNLAKKRWRGMPICKEES